MTGGLEKFRINSYAIIYLLILVIFMMPAVTYFSAGSHEQLVFGFTQAFAHLSGLLFGVCFFVFLKHAKQAAEKRKTHILRGDYS